MKCVIYKLITCLISVGILSVLAGSMTVSASQNGGLVAEELYVIGYEVTNETITPGSDFTLTVKLQNFSPVATAQRAIVVINNPEGVIPEYGTVSQAYLENIGPGDSVEVSFKYNTNTSIEAKSLNFTVNITSEAFWGTTQLRIPVGRMVDFETADVFIPETLILNKTEYLSAMIENLGSMGVSNVVMIARCDGEDIASSNIGTIAAGTIKTQSLSVVLQEEGQHTLELVLTYTNSDGENKEYVIASDIITVSKDIEEIGQTSDLTETENQIGQSSNTQNSIGNNSIIIICICGILLIVVCCIILLLLYRRK